MIFHETTLKDAWVMDIEPRGDARGFFARTFAQEEFAAHGMVDAYVQQNMSVSARKGTIRGLHYQVRPHSEAKVVRCVKGAICDVIVDLRKSSPTFLKYEAFELSADNRRILYCPPGFAHGAMTLTDDVEFTYLVSAHYAASAERGLRFDDPVIGIAWPIPASEVSDKDRAWPDISIETLPDL